MSICVVFVCNKKYFHTFLSTCHQLRTTGAYKGDICLVIGDDLQHDALLQCDGIIVKHFPDIVFPDEFVKINKTIQTDGRNLTKPFQWHKLHLFQTYFKQWDFILYIDCGMTILADISPILREATEHTLLAHSDAYPTYKWKLRSQFCSVHRALYTQLTTTYNVDIDYFQTSIMLYDTKILHDDTFTELLKLAIKYPISKTNEQGILALYFTNIRPLFRQIKLRNEHTYLYDYLSRAKRNKYIMLKMV